MAKAKIEMLSAGVTKMLKDPAFAKELEAIADEALAKNGMSKAQYETEISYTRKDRAQVNIKDVSENPFANEARTGNLNKLAGGSL